LKEFDIVIIGAGPAGSSTALNLADTGLNIAIVDSCTFPRPKVCGDALSGSVLQTLKKFPGNIAEEFQKFEPKLKSTGVRFISPNLTILDLPLTTETDKTIDNPGYLCKRIHFDNFLFKHLEDHSNIVIYQNFKINNIIRNNRKIIVKSNDSEVNARMLIGADGANSIVSKSLANNRIHKEHFSSSVMAYFENVSGFHPENYIELHFLKELLPGYFWIFPMQNNTANVGLGCLSSKVIKKKLNLKNIFNDVISKHPEISLRFKSASRISDLQGKSIPLGSMKKQISGERFILCGDAAGLVNPFTSEGISYAMRSGIMASQQIRKCFDKNDFSEKFMQEYDRNINNKFQEEFRINYKIQKLSSYPWLFNFVVNKINHNPELKDLFISMYNSMDVRSLLTKPSFYFRILFK